MNLGVFAGLGAGKRSPLLWFSPPHLQAETCRGELMTARRSACFSDAFSAGLNDAKIVLALQWLASWSASPL